MQISRDLFKARFFVEELFRFDIMLKRLLNLKLIPKELLWTRFNVKEAA